MKKTYARGGAEHGLIMNGDESWKAHLSSEGKMRLRDTWMRNGAPSELDTISKEAEAICKVLQKKNGGAAKEMAWYGKDELGGIGHSDDYEVLIGEYIKL